MALQVKKISSPDFPGLSVGIFRPARHFFIMSPTPQATRPFSYVAGDAASYNWRRSDKMVPGHAERRTLGAGKDIREKDLLYLRCHNVWTVRYFILHRWAHLSGTQQPCTRLPWDIKGRRSLHSEAIQNTHGRSLDSAPNSSVLGNTSHSGRRGLRSGGPNHSKPAVFIVFLSEIELVAS